MKASKIANVVASSIAPKGDAAIANDAGRVERLNALRNIDTAEDLFGTALVAGLRMTAEFGPTSKGEVAEGYTRCKSPDVYASWFNRGAKAAAVIGIAATLQLIDKASEGKGGFQKAREALASIVTQAKQAGAKELAPKAAKAAVTFALKSADNKSAERKAAAPKAEGLVRRSPAVLKLASEAVNSGKGWAEMAAFVKLASQTAHRMPEPEGREAAGREALAALALACEKFAVFARKA